MLVNKYRNEDCRLSIVGNGDCCCNCIHRYLLMVDNFPIGYYCGVFKDIPDCSLMYRSLNGHGICEMHHRKGANKPEDLIIENF